MALTDYPFLADVFDYPTAGFPERVERARDHFAERYPKASASLGAFLERLPVADLQAMQELYTRSFDVQAITTLDIGYNLFGEDYKRGELLANLSREHRLAQNDCGTELADHLPPMLRLLPKLSDAALAEELVQEIIVPALRKMIGEFDPKRLAAKDEVYKKHHKTLIETSSARTLYHHTLDALFEVLSNDFVLRETPLLEQTSDFLKSVSAELRIEEEDSANASP